MATDASFVDYVQEQSGLGDQLSHRKMFGEYAIYLHGKVVAFACDNQLFVKPTDAGRGLLRQVVEQPAYPGGKPCFRIDEALEDRDLLRRLLQTTERALPAPKPRAGAKAEPVAAQRRRKASGGAR